MTGDTSKLAVSVSPRFNKNEGRSEFEWLWFEAMAMIDILIFGYLGVLLHLIGLTRHKDKSLFHGLLGNDRCLMLESSGDFMFMM